MLSAQISLPNIVESRLDELLAMGWFRFGSRMYTTSFLYFDNELYNAIWLRYVLNDFEPSTSSNRILKLVSKFEIEVVEFQYNNEYEQLYQTYKKSIHFQASETLYRLLYGQIYTQSFKSKAVLIKDNSKLIGCGIFDVGLKSAQGIVSFYDPEYRKLSLGKVLITKKIKYLINEGYQYFYPGYFSPGYPKFDYKLNFGKKFPEFFDLKTKNWYLYSVDQNYIFPLEKIKGRLQNIQNLLQSVGLEYVVYFYEFYEIPILEEYHNYNLLDVPYFIYCSPKNIMEEYLITYSVVHNTYEFRMCKKIFKIQSSHCSHIYNEYILNSGNIIFRYTDPVEFIYKTHLFLITQ